MPWSRSVRRDAPRGAFTLIEILLVLCLLVILASFTWPPLQRSFQTLRLKSAADDVRAQLLRTRTEAVRTGQTYAFSFQPEAGAYAIEPYDTAMAVSESAMLDSETAALADDMGATLTSDYRKEGELPEGIVFQGEVDTTLGISGAAYAGDADVEATGEALTVLFFPDGTAMTAIIQLRNERGRAIELSIRGLTGVVSVSDVFLSESPVMGTPLPGMPPGGAVE
ncbi:MAG: hypothetical protein ACOY3P_24780 [Planctomycetota bacterium]